MARILGIDYGRRRIGVAVTDPLAIFAQPLKVLEVRNAKDAFTKIAALIEAYEIGTVVVGVPLDADGERGPMADEVNQWVTGLREVTAGNIVTRDERYSSQWADRVAAETGLRGKKKKAQRDALAAQAILDDFLREQRSLV